jgi:hypothetical protein
MTTIRFAVGALKDLDEGFYFYERKEPGLSEYFRTCIKGDIEGSKITAGIHRKTFKDYNRLISRVFPHAVYYTTANEEVVVWAEVDCRRHPDWIMERLSR